jgi:hypothetical protein
MIISVDMMGSMTFSGTPSRLRRMTPEFKRFSIEIQNLYPCTTMAYHMFHD